MNIRMNTGFVIVFAVLSANCVAQVPSGLGKARSISTIKGNKILVTALDAFVNKQMDSLHIPGLSLAVINSGKIAYYKNYGVKNSETGEKVNDHTIFEACSVSKPVFAYFVLKQVEKGILQLDKPLHTYYTDPKIDTTDGYYRLVTARMVLNHCSGFPNWRKDEDDSNPLLFISKPGTKYGYSGEGYQYLARVLGKILRKSDQELNDYFQEEVVQSLEIASMNFTWKDTLQPLKAFSHSKGKPTDNTSQGPPDWFGAAGSLHTSAKDYAKFLVAIMNSRNKVGKKLITLQTGLPTEPDSLYRSFGFPYKISKGKIRYYHMGNNSDTRAYCHFYKNEGMGIVMFGNCDNFFSAGFAQKLLAYMEEEVIY